MAIDNSDDSSRQAVGGVGLSDEALSTNRSRMLALMNRLHDTGVQADMNLPQIAVIGSQSVGKSSLIESISGITLPRASGTCTRCPTECRLSYSTEPWKCQIKLRFTVDSRGNLLERVKTVPFGKTITDKAEVEERLRRAQRAILHPNVDAKDFLVGEEEDFDDGPDSLDFSPNCILLDIAGPDLTDLSFCDLPGMIANVREGGKDTDIDLVKSLITSYISKSNCLILLAVACETDFENQGAHRLAKEHDRNGQRTIGVLTKPDRIEAGNEAKWLKILRNEQERLLNGWYCVKQPEPADLERGISWEEARSREVAFFRDRKPWSTQSATTKLRLGTSSLTKHLSDVLSRLIQQRLPGITAELQKMLDETRQSLRDLPSPIPEDPLPEVLRIVHDFQRDVADFVLGRQEGDLHVVMNNMHKDFQQAIRRTAPNFNPFSRSGRDGDERQHWEHSASDIPAFLADEEVDEQLESDVIYADEVMSKAQNARTRELPGYFPFSVQQNLILDFVKKWKQPALDLFDGIQLIMTEYLKQIIRTHFSKFEYGGFEQVILNGVMDQIQSCREETLEKLAWNLKVEQSPFTMNTHYLSDYTEKFLTHFRSSRQRNGVHGDFIQLIGSPGSRLEVRTPSSTGYPTSSRRRSSISSTEAVQEVLSGIARMSGPQVQPPELAKLLPTDPMEPALRIMADVRAYYQVAYKRYCDTVPLTIDCAFVRGVDEGIRKTLVERLAISEPQAKERFRGYLEQDPGIVAQRDDLQSKLQRLEAARAELAAI